MLHVLEYKCTLFSKAAGNATIAMPMIGRHLRDFDLSGESVFNIVGLADIVCNDGW